MCYIPARVLLVVLHIVALVLPLVALRGEVVLHVGALRRVVLHSEEAPARIAEANGLTQQPHNPAFPR